MARVDVRGAIVPNNYSFYYDFWGMDYTCPKMVKDAINALEEGEDLEVYVNSQGGVIDVGSEIYTLLREVGSKHDVKIYITGEACSAASIISMAGHCEMSPTSLMMVHCVSTWAGGNHTDMEHTAEMLRTADKALCSAYTEKTGMTEEEALAMMEHETWLTAEQAKEKGLIDGIMFEEQELVMTNSCGFRLPTTEQMEAVKRAMTKETNYVEISVEGNHALSNAVATAKLNLLKLNRRR